jgi:hypothetical protein
MEGMSLLYFENTINNSLLPLEKENYYKTLKALNLTNLDIYNFITDIALNYVKIIDGNPIPIFTNFSENLMISSLTPFIYSENENHKKALLNLENHLKTIIAIFENQLLLSPNPLVEIKYLEEFKIKVNKRFHETTNKNNQQLSFKGYHSFQLNNPLKLEQKIRLLKQLKESGLISKKTNMTQIESVFIGKVVEENNKISWNNFHDIYLFVKNLKPNLLHQNDVFETALRCFTKKGLKISNIKQLTKSSGGDKNLNKIKEIISIFETNQKI